MKSSEVGRIIIPFTPPFVFDCRFNGAAERIVQNEYQQFMDAFGAVSKSVKDGMVSCEIGPYTADAIRILTECKTQNETLVALRRHRYTIAGQVQERIGRPVSNEVVRRMGIGDQIVLFSVIQSVAELVGKENIHIVHDPLYPGTTELLQLFGFRNLHVDIPQFEATLIPCKRHMLEHPVRDGLDADIGESYGNPAAQVLWNWGWLDKMDRVGRVGEYHFAGLKKTRPDALTRYATAQPLEATRRNVYATPVAYSAAIQLTLPAGVTDIVWGCATGEELRLKKFVSDCCLPAEYANHFVAVPLAEWAGYIACSDILYTGNTSGMWLGFAAQKPKKVLFAHDGPEHGSMWHPRRGWFGEAAWKKIILIN